MCIDKRIVKKKIVYKPICFFLNDMLDLFFNA